MTTTPHSTPSSISFEAVRWDAWSGFGNLCNVTCDTTNTFLLRTSFATLIPAPLGATINRHPSLRHNYDLSVTQPLSFCLWEPLERPWTLNHISISTIIILCDSTIIFLFVRTSGAKLDSTIFPYQPSTMLKWEGTLIVEETRCILHYTHKAIIVLSHMHYVQNSNIFRFSLQISSLPMSFP